MRQRLLKNTVIYGVGNVVQKGFSFVVVFLYARYLSVSEIGILNVLQTFSAIYVLFFSFGIERSLYRLYHDYKSDEQRKKLLGNVYIVITITGAITVCVTLLLSSQVSSLLNNILFYPFIFLSMLDAIYTALTIAPKILFQVEQKPLKFLLLSLGQPLLTLLLLIVALLQQYSDVESILKVTLISYVLFAPINILFIAKNATFQFDKKIIRNILLFSLPLLPMLLSSWVVNMSDRLFLSRFYTMDEVGVYSVVYKVGQAVQLFATALLMAYAPSFYALANKETVDEKQLNKMHNQNILISLILCGYVAIISNDLITLFFSTEYIRAIYIAPIVVAGYFFIQMTGFQNIAFTQCKKTTSLMFLGITSAVVNIVLNYFLIKHWGMYGAAAATLTTQVLLFMLSYFYSIRFYFLRVEFKPLATLFFSFAVCVFFAYSFLHAGYLSLFLKTLIFVIAFLLFFRKFIGDKLSFLKQKPL